MFISITYKYQKLPEITIKLVNELINSQKLYNAVKETVAYYHWTDTNTYRYHVLLDI